MDARTANGQPEDRDGFRFRGGSVVLDLAATLRARLSPAPQELLAASADLERWLRSSGLAVRDTRATDTDVATARALREAIFTLAGEAVPRTEAARQTINRIAATPAAAPVLGIGGGVTLEGTVAQLLSSLAREAVRLFGGGAAARIRQCQSPTCAILFLDTSRTGDRRWCSMAACGNKAKVAEFRRRRRAARRDG